jgi:hypothetical protein
VSLVVFSIGVDDRNLDAVQQPDRVDANFAAVLEAIVDPLNSRTFENPEGIGKGNRVPSNVGKVLVRVPGEPHDTYLRDVFTGFKP